MAKRFIQEEHIEQLFDMEKILKDFKNKEWSAEVYGIGNTTFYSPYEVNVIFEGRKRNSSELIEKVHKFYLKKKKRGKYLIQNEGHVNGLINGQWNAFGYKCGIIDFDSHELKNLKGRLEVALRCLQYGVKYEWDTLYDQDHLDCNDEDKEFYYIKEIVGVGFVKNYLQKVREDFKREKVA